MFVPIVLVGLACFAIYFYLFSNKKKLNLPPGPNGVPIFGNMFQMTSTNPNEAFTKWQREFGDIYTLKMGGVVILVLGDTKLIKKFFNEPIFNGRVDNMLIGLLSNGLHGVTLSEGQEWVDQRRFTLRHLRNFGFGKNYMESLIMDEVKECIDWLKVEEGNSVKMEEKFDLAVLNSLWMISTGKRFNHDDPHKLKLLNKIRETFTKPSVAAMLYMMAPKLLRLFPEMSGLNRCNEVKAEYHAMLDEVINEHEATLPEDEQNARDFIDAYLHEIKRTNDQNSSFYKETGRLSLMATIGDLFFGGAETTSATLSWTILYLALNPDVQKKLQGEIDRVVGQSRPVSLADKPDLPYAEATWHEIFRLSSVAGTGFPHRTTEDTKFMDYDLPKGTVILSNFYAIHRDPKIWGDPEVFRPERFLSEDGKTCIKNESLTQFSVGKRSCIGENLARDNTYLFMTNIFQRFTVKPDPSKPRPTFETRGQGILKPLEYRVIMKDRFT